MSCIVGSLAHAAAIRNAGPTPPMREGQSVTALPDGRILIYGAGYGASLGWSPQRRNWEAFGPAAGSSPRYLHSATLATDGRVVIAGGVGSLEARAQDPKVLSSTMTWYPQTGKWVGGVSLLFGRFAHTATPLPGGDVLLIGGASGAEGSQPRGPFLVAAERVAANSSRQVKSASVARASHTATLLPDGRVLVVGGLNEEGVPIAHVEIYDVAKDEWTIGAPLHVPRADHTATLLPGGRVLVVGGRTMSGTRIASTEIWSSETGEWADGPPLTQPRSRHATTLLKDGSVLVAGGRELDERAAVAVELLAPQGQRWEVSVTLPRGMPDPHSLLLANGNVILIGLTLRGSSNEGDGPFVWLPHGDSDTRFIQRTRYQTTLLADGRVLVSGGDTDRIHSRIVQIYDPATGEWEDTEAMQLGRSGHQTFVLPDGRVVVGGGWVSDPTTGQNSDDSRDSRSEPVPSEIWNPRTGRWTTSALVPRNTFWTELGSLPDGRLFSQYVYDMPREPFLAWMHRWRTTDADIGEWLRVERPRKGGAAAVLPGGGILFAGGEGAVSRSDVWQPATGAWRSLRPFEGLPQAIRLVSLGDGRVIAVSTNTTERQEALPVWTETTGLWGVVPLPAGLNASQIQQASGLADGRMLLLMPDRSLLWDEAAERWDAIQYDIDWSPGARIVSLPNGRVIAFREPARGQDRPTSVVELDEARKVWRADLSRYIPRRNPAVVPLKDGTALVAGGDTAVAQLWKLADDSWEATGFLHSPLLNAQGLPLPDGRVMVVGWPIAQDRLECELWSATTGSFTSCGSLAVPGNRSSTFWLAPLAGQRVLAIFARRAAIWSERGGWETVTLRWPDSLQQPYGNGSISFLEPVASAWDPAEKKWRDVSDAYFRLSGTRASVTLADDSVLRVSGSAGDQTGLQWIPATRQLERMEFRGGSARGPSEMVRVDGRCAAAWSSFAAEGRSSAGRETAPGIRLLDFDAKQWFTSEAATIELIDAGYAVTADGVLLMAGTNRFEAGGRGTQRFRLSCRQAVPIDADSSLYLPVADEPERKVPAASAPVRAAESKTSWSNWRIPRAPPALVLLFLLLFLPPIIRYIVRKRA